MRHGFTLIELLVAITIIGVLMGIGFAAFKHAQTAGRDAKRKSDLAQIRAALEIYKNTCDNRYPRNLNFGQEWKSDCNADGTDEIYMAKLPQDPQNSSGYSYCYSNRAGDTRTYYLAAKLEKGADNALNESYAKLCINSTSPTNCFGDEHSCNYALIEWQ